MDTSSDESKHLTSEETKSPADYLNLRVMEQNGNAIFFKIRKTTPMKKLMQTYCDRQGVSMDSIRFLYNGERIQFDQDPSQLDMEDEDVIDAVLAQSKSTSSSSSIYLENN